MHLNKRHKCSYTESMDMGIGQLPLPITWPRLTHQATLAVQSVSSPRDWNRASSYLGFYLGPRDIKEADVYVVGEG